MPVGAHITFLGYRLFSHGFPEILQRILRNSQQLAIAVANSIISPCFASSLIYASGLSFLFSDIV